MRKIVVALITGAILVGGAASATAGPVEDVKDIINWLKDPCVPTGDLEDDCRLP